MAQATRSIPLDRMARAALPEDVKYGPFAIPGTGYAAFTREEGDKITATQKLNKG